VGWLVILASLLDGYLIQLADTHRDSPNLANGFGLPNVNTMPKIEHKMKSLK
jgi:hypothetical protein